MMYKGSLSWAIVLHGEAGSVLAGDGIKSLGPGGCPRKTSDSWDVV